MSYCSACGTAQTAGATLCPNCGNPVATSASTGAPPAASPDAAPPTAPTGGFGAPIAPAPAGIPGTGTTSTAAIISLVLGIACYVILPFLGAIGAVVAGHMARKEIRDSHGRIQGNGLALAGLILGYAHFALFCLAVAVFLAIMGVAASGTGGSP